MRLVTSAKVFAKHTTIKDAISAVDKILAEPGVAMATLGAEWLELRELCAAKNLSGNDVPDAWLAEATSYVGEHLVTFAKLIHWSSELRAKGIVDVAAKIDHSIVERLRDSAEFAAATRSFAVDQGTIISQS